MLAFLLVAFGSIALHAQPARLHDVKAWRGKFTAKAHTNDSRSGKGWEEINPWSATSQYNGSVVVEFLLDEFEDEPAVWTGRVVSSSLTAAYRSVAIGEGKGGAVVESDFSTSGPLDAEPDRKVKLTFHRERGWSLSVGNVWRTARATQVTTLKPTGMVIRDVRDDRAYALRNTPTLPYPEKGLVLSASGRVGGGTGGLNSISLSVSLPLEWDYAVQLEPVSLQELRLEIEESKEYADWRPDTTPDGAAGKPLDIVARVVTADGAAPRTTVESFEWQLEDTSREPGVALNFPVDSRNQRFDLELDATGEFFVLSAQNQKMVRAVRSGFSDTVKVVPFDWGGWSTLQVTAVLADGRRITGKVKGRSEEGLRVPKRAFDSHIADSWKKKTVGIGADRSDDDNAPVGDGTKGDGLTLYEEYRGFYEAGDHIEGDPKTKDFFVRLKQAGVALRGVGKFQRITKLKVHANFSGLEFPESRIINANYDRGAHLTSQHGVIVRIDKTRKGSAIANGGPGTPRMISTVDLMGNVASMDPHWIASTVAHELGHCVNLYHHGESDKRVLWGTADGKVFELAGQGAAPAEIEVVNEEFSDLKPAAIAAIQSDGESKGKYIVVELGRDQGQHSGAENCVMRYDSAQAYVYRAMANVRFWGFQELIGDGLCVSVNGNEINKSGRLPQSRYGPAAGGRGNCLHQLLVSDAATPPSRVAVPTNAPATP
jgi:hypothetical protein